MVVFPRFLKPRASPFKMRSSASLGPFYQGYYLCAVLSATEGARERAHGGGMAAQKGNCCWPGNPKSPFELSLGVSAGFFSEDAQVRPCERETGWGILEGRGARLALTFQWLLYSFLVCFDDILSSWERHTKFRTDAWL